MVSRSCFSFFLLELSIRFSMSVVMPQEWDSEEGYLRHIHPTKVSRTKPGRIPPQCHDISCAEHYTFI